MNPTAFIQPRTRSRGQETSAPVGLIFISVSVRVVEITFLVSPNASAIESVGRNNSFALSEGVIDLRMMRRPIQWVTKTINGDYLPVIVGG